VAALLKPLADDWLSQSREDAIAADVVNAYDTVDLARGSAECPAGCAVASLGEGSASFMG
jgi:hypothetical protein